MGKTYDAIEGSIREFIEAQRVFFVATAPLGEDGHVNLSPKGLDGLRVLGERTVGYLDFVGSGVETIAHLRENGRIVLMFCALDGPPKIVRIHGRGRALEPGDPEFAELRPRFAHGGKNAVRAIIVVAAERVSDSCGFGVPLYDYQGERPQLGEWTERKGPEKIVKYQVEKNARSIDGLPGLARARERGSPD